MVSYDEQASETFATQLSNKIIFYFYDSKSHNLLE